MISRAIALVCLALLIFTVETPRALAADDAVIVGFLETPSSRQRATLEKEFGQMASAVVRVAFRRQAGVWQPFKSDVADVDELKAASTAYPAWANWTIAFSGKSLGQLSSSMPTAWQRYSEIGLQLASADRTLPHVGKPSPEFEAWGSDGPVYRPLVLVSRPNVRDPDRWTPTKLTPADLKQALPLLRKAIKEEEDGLSFRDRDVRQTQAYRWRQGQVLFALAVRDAGRRRDQVPGPGRSLHWFVARTPGAVRFLGSELVFLDAGDYDNDGRSEVVFMRSGYDRDGYVLFSDDFAHSAEFSWASH